MNSLEIREAKMKLIDMVNSIRLPLEVKRMMVREIMAELESAAEREINAYLSERESAEKDKHDVAEKKTEE